MDIYTKIFLINLILLFFVLWFDKNILNVFIDKHDFLRICGGGWILFTLCSVPAWMIYLIVEA